MYIKFHEIQNLIFTVTFTVSSITVFYTTNRTDMSVHRVTIARPVTVA